MSAERIVVRLPNWLGDAMLARPLLHGLRQTRRDAAIGAVGPRALLDLLAAEGLFDRTDPWPADLAGRRRLQGDLRRWKPGVALILPPSFSSALFAWRSGAKTRIGHRHEGRDLLLTHPIGRSARGEMHLSREFLALGEPLAIREGTVPDLRPAPPAVEAAARLIDGEDTGGARFAILAPGAAFGPGKRWPVDRFAELGRRLAAGGWRLWICGVEAEREDCERVAGAVGPAARSLAGRTGVEVLAALCARASLVVSNDSGLAHLAAAAGRPTVAIFGSTSSSWTAPLGQRVRIVQRPPVCSPCFQRTCRIGYRCLTAIEVGAVATAAAELVA